MSAITDAWTAVQTACALSGLRVYRTENLAMMQVPGIVVSPPTIAWETYNPGPTSLVFTVWVVGQMNDNSIAGLLDAVVAVQAAIESTTNASVAVATPSTLELTGRVKGASDYPAYLLTVEYPL